MIILSATARRVKVPGALLAVGLIALAIGLAGCKKGPSNLSFGEPCSKGKQCRSGICLFEGHESEDGMCARSCSADSDCPEGWSCTGMTEKGVIVCRKGPPTPFGF